MNPLIAILLALAVLVIGIIGYFTMFQTSSQSANAQSAQQSVQSIFSTMSQQFATNPNFTGLTIGGAAGAGVFPSTWVTGTAPNQTVMDPWGGTVSLAPAGINGGTDNGWALTVPNVPQAECTQVASFYTPQTASISVNGTSVWSNPSYGGSSVGAPSPASIQTACANPQNSIVWTVSGQ